jgi:hypothetical protein
MKRLILATLVAAAFLIAPGPAYAVCGDGSSICFWGGAAGANMSAANWSSTSGGGTGQTPIAGDALCFDSANNNNAALNTAFTQAVRSINTAGTCAGGSGSPYTGTITHAAALVFTVSGNDAGAAGGTTFLIDSASGWTAANATTSDITFTATSGTTTVTLNSSGASRNVGDVIFNGSGGSFVLGSDLTNTATSSIVSTAGALNFGGFNVSAGFFDLSGTTARTVTCGSGTLTAKATSGVPWSVTNNANLTLTCNTGSVDVNATPTVNRAITFGGKTYNNFTITQPSGNGYAMVNNQGSTTSTFANLTFANLRGFLVSGSSSVFTITGTFSWTGMSSSNVGWIASDASVPTYTVNPAAATTLDWVCISGMIEGGAGSVAGNLDCGLNSGPSFSAPSGGGARGMIIP